MFMANRSHVHLSRMLNTLHHCQLLIVDELEHMTLDQKNSNPLFQVLAGRYEARNTIAICSLTMKNSSEKLTVQVQLRATFVMSETLNV